LFAFNPRQNPTIENNPQAHFNDNFFFAGILRAGVIPLQNRILAIVRDDTQMAVRPLATVKMVIFGQFITGEIISHKGMPPKLRRV
jgi:hypothetical protein